MLRNLLFFTALLCAGSANAALFNVTGNISYHNDVVFIDFSLDNDATDVRVWTDSFQSGTNFDPITALWDGAGNLINENDDNSSINPATQSTYDSGFALDFLAAGDYTFSIATYNNYALGSTVSDGFRYDAAAPILLSDWCQPANDCNMGSYWSVWLDGVDSASGGGTPVPAPSPLLLMGLGGLMLLLRRRNTLTA